MSFYVFAYIEPRQDIAELFVVLAVMLIVSSYRQELKRSAVLIVFIASLVVSHYSTTYLFLFYVAIIFIGSALLAARNRTQCVRSGLSATLAALTLIMAFGWYALTSGAAALGSLTLFGGRTVSTVSSELFSSGNQQVAYGLGIGVSSLPFAHALANYWGIATEILITLGLVLFILGRRTLKTNLQFLLLMVASYLFLLAAVAVPAVANAITTYRLYAIALLFLAPCCVFGIEFVTDATSRRLRANQDLARQLKNAALIGVLVPYLLFNYGVIFEITEHSSNYAFLPSPQQSERALIYSYNASWSYLVAPPTSRENVYASTWLSSSRGRSPVFSDVDYLSLLAAYGQMSPGSTMSLTAGNVQQPLSNAYVFLGVTNVQQGTIGLLFGGVEQHRQISSYPTLAAGETIYSNGLTEVRYYPG